MNLTVTLVGLVVGTFIGISGVGGSSLMTPLLILLLRVHPVMAVGTDLVYSVPTKLLGTAIHGHNRTIDRKLVIWLLAGGIPGALAGLAVAAYGRRHFSLDALDSLVRHAVGVALIVSAVVLVVGIFARRTPRQPLRQAQGDGGQAPGALRQAQGDGGDARGALRQAQGDGGDARGALRQAQGDGGEARGALRQAQGDGGEDRGALRQAQGDGGEDPGALRQAPGDMGKHRHPELVEGRQGQYDGEQPAVAAAPDIDWTRATHVKVSALGFFVGSAVSITSIGSGAITLPVLYAVLPRLGLRRLVGSDIAFATFLLPVAAVGNFLLGNVDLHLAANLLLGSLPGVVLGSYLCRRLPEYVLRPAVAGILIFAGTRLV